MPFVCPVIGWEEPPISDPESAQRVETGIEFIRQGISACEQLDDATDEELESYS